MRRKDKEITDRVIIEELLNKSKVLRLAMVDGNKPYIIPLNFGYRDNSLYFHCATEGRKIDLLKLNNNVSFEVDFDLGLRKAELDCDWGQNYSSVIGFGKAYFISEPEEKIKALDYIMEHYSDKAKFEYSEKVLNRVLVIKVEIDSMSGKGSAE